MSAPIPLRELEGEICVTDWGDGLKIQTVHFDCPSPSCNKSHIQAIYYSDAPSHRIPRPARFGEGTINLWQRVSGTTINDITLAPSVLVASCDGLHGYIVNGEWRPC